jgi:ribosome biogenesis protein SSF1/2
LLDLLFSDVITVSSGSQESEGEEAGESRVTLAQDLGRGNLAARQSRVQLQEVHFVLNLSDCWRLAASAADQSAASHVHVAMGCHSGMVADG